jgi:hypothetical protein
MTEGRFIKRGALFGAEGSSGGEGEGGGGVEGRGAN